MPTYKNPPAEQAKNPPPATNVVPMFDEARKTLVRFYRIFGHAVFIILRPRSKAAADKNWQNITFAETKTPEYQNRLLEIIASGGSIGGIAAVMGPASNNLQTTDVDEDELAEIYLSDNPLLANTTRTRGRRGCNFWFRIKPETSFPNEQSNYKLKTAEGNDYGEYRCGKGAYVMFFGLHPDTGEPYQFLCDKPVIEIEYRQLKWLGLAPDEKPLSEEEQVFQELQAKFEHALRTSAEFKSLNIVPRKLLLGQWLREGDLSFVYGDRGSGKTWLVNAIAAHVSAGRDLFAWAVPEAAPVMIIDGEMPLDDSQDRIKGMHPGELLHILHHEVLFEESARAMNFTSTTEQQIITALCLKRAIKLLILDNLSCLFSGMKENDADEWEKVQNWLLDLRRRRIAVLIVHHSGRSGDHMRGTSKREDAAFSVIKVEEIKQSEDNDQGARFETSFEKIRGPREWCRQWTFNTESNGEISISCDEISFDRKVLELIQAGLTSATDISEELKSAKSSVSRAAARLENDKLIEKSGRGYRPRGFMQKNGNEAP